MSHKPMKEQIYLQRKAPTRKQNSTTKKAVETMSIPNKIQTIFTYSGRTRNQA
eukprot:CAMPEP_0169301442 /NCGR_PEP_ID=MMETSP1016-20121227/68254_1 /TAXON_ID=342587 /ORGANISM="Karlodinium micrum, Strain CCMP2283" /LENGTH=52 /DNA_ID=CAMNT_0009394057 /DNA_START=26 /DNA_END=181 /DNA_ORIENTATION=-